MARRSDGSNTSSTKGETATRRVDHSTARAFAAALSALAISSLVVTTSSTALQPDGTIAANHLEAGTVSISDDDGGQSLVDLTNMAPGRPEEQCIEVVYDGSIVPVVLTLAATTSGTLAPFVDMQVERGTGASYGDCEGFETTETLFVGRLSELAAVSPMPLGRLLNQGDAIAFRFVFELADEEAAVGQASATDFIWEVTPE